MLKYVLASVLFALSFSVVSTPQAEAGVFANRPVRTFFQNRKPVRKLLKAAVRVAVAPVKFVATKKPVRSALFGRQASSTNSSARSAGCNCVDCQCINCNCGVASSGCTNCGTEE